MTEYDGGSLEETGETQDGPLAHCSLIFLEGEVSSD